MTITVIDDTETTTVVVDETQIVVTSLSVNNTAVPFTQADKTKLDQLSADTPSDLLDLIKTVDGNASGLDADLLDGLEATQFIRKDIDNTANIQLTLRDLVVTQNISVAGIIDGRDISADGTKLDTIETNAKDDQTAVEVVYDNTDSGLSATNVKAALDELAATGFTSTTITTSATVDLTKNVIFIDASSNDITHTLPTAVGNTNKLVYLKRIDVSNNVVTLATFGSETIENLSSGTIDNGDSLPVISNGTNWYIL